MLFFLLKLNKLCKKFTNHWYKNNRTNDRLFIFVCFKHLVLIKFIKTNLCNHQLESTLYAIKEWAKLLAL